jgi:hypothetical protein
MGGDESDGAASCFRPSPGLPGDAPLRGGAEEPLDTSLEAAAQQVAEQLHAQDMDRRGAAAAGDDDEPAAAEYCGLVGLVGTMQQMWDTTFAWGSGSSDAEGAGLREPLNQRLAREEAEMAASLDRHAASPRPATGPHGIDPVSGGNHERQLASEAATTAARERQMRTEIAAHRAEGTGGGAELAVDLTLALTDGDAVERTRRAISRAIAASQGYPGGRGLSLPVGNPDRERYFADGMYLPRKFDGEYTEIIYQPIMRTVRDGHVYQQRPEAGGLATAFDLHREHCHDSTCRCRMSEASRMTDQRVQVQLAYRRLAFGKLLHTRLGEQALWCHGVEAGLVQRISMVPLRAEMLRAALDFGETFEG